MALRRASCLQARSPRSSCRSAPRRRMFGASQPSNRFRANSDLCVAALQCNSQASNSLENLKHVQALLRVLVKEAPRHPDIILLPELFHCNYDLDFSTAWNSAEPMVEERSATLRYMRSWALEHKCFIGGTMLEAHAVDFYNSFVMYTPGGQRINKVLRKSRPASIEAFIFSGTNKLDDHVLELDLAQLPAFAGEKSKYLRPLRVGVAICYENMLASVMRPLQDAQLDLLLSPYCAPEPIPMAGFDEPACQQYRDSLEAGPRHIAKYLNTYVVSANKAGPWRTVLSRFLGVRVLPEMNTQWLALTGVHAPDGSTLAALPANVNSLCTSTIPLSPHPRPRSKEVMPVYYSNEFILRMPRIISVSFPLMETLGFVSYRYLQSRLRTRIATDRFLK